MSDRFDAAFLLASRLHRKQVRKGTDVPYLAHLLGVTALVVEAGGDENEAIAALLHDAVEDQGGLPTLDIIRAQFGERVAEIVLGCTDADTRPKPPWRARKVAYLAHLGSASASARLVSCADKLHNARAILADLREVGDAVWERFAGGTDGTLWYYRGLADAFKSGPNQRLADELSRTVTEIERLTAER